jgi:hypothetical protein
MEISLDLADRCLESTWSILSNAASIEVSDRGGKIWSTSSKSSAGHMHELHGNYALRESKVQVTCTKNCTILSYSNFNTNLQKY